MHEHPLGVEDEESAGVDQLRARLAEAEETLRAIRHGEVDALLIVDGAGERVYTLRSADAPYRALVEQMQEAAVTLNTKGDIIYGEQEFRASCRPHRSQHVIGSSIDQFIDSCRSIDAESAASRWRGTLHTRHEPHRLARSTSMSR